MFTCALQVELTKFPALPPVSHPSPNAQQQLSLARTSLFPPLYACNDHIEQNSTSDLCEGGCSLLLLLHVINLVAIVAGDVLELAVLASVRQGDDAAFDRNYAQLRPFYLDARPALPNSQQEPLLSGLRLMVLLVQNRISEFHTEVELLPQTVLATPEVAEAMKLEAMLMEGAYSKVLLSRASPVSPYYLPLLNRLAATVRDEVSSCIEAAYESLSTSSAAHMLRFDSEAELAAYARQRGWTMEGGLLMFTKDQGAVGGEKSKAPPAFEVIEHCLEYAKELERIV